jgi:sugar/nucleoside kinase (ribokinase family)
MFGKNIQYDFLGFGDIVTDAFIELDEAWIETDNPKKEKELCMKFGSKLPYKDSVVVPAVGNSANAAVSAHRLGLKSTLYTNIGDDRFGMEQANTLKEQGVSLECVKIHPGRKSNYHYVLRFGAERTILVNHQEWDYKLKMPKKAPRAIYLSSLAANSLEFHHTLANYLKDNPETKLVFQPGTFQMKLGYEALKDLYQQAWLFFCNKEEAQRILETDEDDMVKLLEMMNEKGVEMPIISDGRNGAFAWDNGTVWKAPMYPDPKPPVDRTGAGDSFSSTVTSALLLGKPIEEALLWGPINSMSVVQYIGAQEGLLSRDKLEEYLKNAPEDYKIEKVK